MTQKSKSKVLFVGGYGRSGSTLIDLLLDRVPGIVAVGEFRHLFGRAMGDNELCSCSEKFLECPFWSSVIKQAFPKKLDRERTLQAMKRINRVASTTMVRNPEKRSDLFKEDARIYEEALDAAYRAVLSVAKAKVVVDSSKYPLHGLFLKTMQNIDLSVMLLVRDPRAVAHSWQRKVVRPEVHWEERFMPRYSVARSALAWNASNKLTSYLDDGTTPYRVQRYEDFVKSPLKTIQEIASFALGEKIKLDTSLFAETDHVTHTIAGNPRRLGGKEISVNPDAAWQEEMPSHKKQIVSTIAHQQMKKYQYK